MLLAENADQRLVDFLELRGAHLPGSVNDDVRVCRKQSSGSDAADLAEPAAYKVAGVEWYGVAILTSLTRDLAKNEIVTL